MGLFDLGVDWSEVEAPAFEEIPPGIYEAELIDIEPWEKDGQRAFVFSYQITEDEANDGRFVGKTKKEFKNITNKQGEIDRDYLGYVKARVIDLGAPADADLNSLDTDTLIGATVALTLKKRGDYVNVSKVVLIGGGAAKPAPAANKAAAGAPAASATADDEDNPFA